MVSDEAEAEMDADPSADPDEWKIESIIARRVVRGRSPEYKVRWEGFSSKDDAWEPEANVADCSALDLFL